MEKLTNLSKKIPSDLLNSLKEQKNNTKIADHISGQLNISIPEKQKLDAAVDFVKTLESMGVEEAEIKAIGEYDPKLEEAVNTVFEEYEEEDETYNDRYEDD